MSFIEDLLSEIKTKQASDELAKQAGEMPPQFKKKDEKEEKEKDKKDDKSDKSDKKGDKDEKDDKEKKGSALFAELLSLNPELQKIASLEAESLFLANLKHSQVFGGATKEAALSSADEEAIFNDEFESHTLKLAAADPEYARIIEGEQIKAAFDEGCYQELLAIKQAHNIDDATFGQILAEVGIH